MKRRWRRFNSLLRPPVHTYNEVGMVVLQYVCYKFVLSSYFAAPQSLKLHYQGSLHTNSRFEAFSQRNFAQTPPMIQTFRSNSTHGQSHFAQTSFKLRL